MCWWSEGKGRGGCVGGVRGRGGVGVLGRDPNQ